MVHYHLLGSQVCISLKPPGIIIFSAATVSVSERALNVQTLNYYTLRKQWTRHTHYLHWIPDLWDLVIRSFSLFVLGVIARGPVVWSNLPGWVKSKQVCFSSLFNNCSCFTFYLPFSSVQNEFRGNLEEFGQQQELGTKSSPFFLHAMGKVGKEIVPIWTGMLCEWFPFVFCLPLALNKCVFREDYSN